MEQLVCDWPTADEDFNDVGAAGLVGSVPVNQIISDLKSHHNTYMQ